MLRKVFYAVFVCSIAAICLPSYADEPGVPGKIVFESAKHDFGKISPDSYNNCSFKFKNTGEGTLEISRIKGTCKCTVPQLKKKEYAPDENGEVTVKFHAPKFQGPTSQHIFVFSNDPANPKYELEIKATVAAKVATNPERMNLSLLEDNAGAGEITIKSKDGKKFKIKKVISNGDVFDIAFDADAESDSFVLKPVVDVKNLKNFLNGTIVFEISHPECKMVKVDYNCMREFEASPSALIIRNAQENESQTREIYLTSNYSQPITVESVASEKGYVKVASQLETANRFEFKVEITPPAREGKLRVFSDNLVIKIKDKDEIRIPCRGFYKAK